MTKIRYPLKDLLKARHTNEPITNIFTDRIDNIITWFLANYTKVTPNTVTTIGNLFGIASAYFFFTNQLFLGAVFYFIRHLSDGIDGRLSRLTGQGSKFGAWYENYMGMNVTFLNILGFCIGQYIITQKIIWLIFAPLLMHSFRMHSWASMKVAILLGEKFKDEVVKHSKDNRKKTLINSIKKMLSDIGIVEPFNAADGVIILFFLNPIIGPLLGITSYVVIAWLIIVTCKEIFWFFYYRHILKKFDAEEKAKNKHKTDKSIFEK